MTKIPTPQSMLIVGIVGLSLAAFIVGFGTKALIDSLQPRAETWQEVITVMPAQIKEAIAIDYCVAHRRMCRNLPLSSPINPMDGRK